jgi:diamine N-acetyltransferase
MPPRISLQPITSQNWEEIVALRLSPGQKMLFAPNWYSLLQAQYDGGEVRAIYVADTVIGFAYFQVLPTGDATLLRFMIDHDFQGFGYGKAALATLLNLLHTQYGIGTVWLTIAPNNLPAIQLFERAGFAATGDMDFDEAVYVLQAGG